jgi:hypothetical protein
MFAFHYRPERAQSEALVQDGNTPIITHSPGYNEKVQAVLKTRKAGKEKKGDGK